MRAWFRKPGGRAPLQAFTAGGGFESLSMHRKMLGDSRRCELFREALRRSVPPGGVVLDVGAGSGILSVFAAQAGARKVYAVERTAIAELAREVVLANGLGDRVEVIQAPIEAVELGEPVDLIVSEWLGGMAVEEAMLGAVLLARDRWLRPGGVLIPGRVSAWIAPCWSSWLEAERDRWRQRPYGVDLAPVAAGMARELEFERHEVGPEDLLSAGEVWWQADLARCATSRAAHQTGSATFLAARDGRINCLASWFGAELCPELTLSNAPDAPPTHWGRVLLPLDRALEVRAGACIHARIDARAEVSGGSFRWSVRAERWTGLAR